MVYKYIKERRSGKKKRSNNLKKKIFLFSFLFLIILIVIITVFNIQNYIKLIGKTIGVGSSDNEFKAERCADWGRCTVDYNFRDVNNLNNFNLVGTERRECLANNKIIVQRRPCDPTVSVKTKRTDKEVVVFGPPPHVEGVLPSLKRIDKGVEVLEPIPGAKEEIPVSKITVFEEKGIKKLNIEILI